MTFEFTVDCPRSRRPHGSILALGILTLSACQNQQIDSPTQEQSSDAVAQAVDDEGPSTANAEGRPYEDVVELPGASVHGYESTEIFAKLGGYIAQLGTVGEQPVDIGTRVERGAMLAVLDIPEMMDELTEKTAAVNQAHSEVAQAEAGVAEAEAAKLQREAELDQVKARRKEKQAMVGLNETKLQRVSTLARSGNIGQEVLDESRFALEAAEAALASLDADVAAAEKQVGAAAATIKKTEADKASALAHVELANAALARVKTMMAYSTVRAPFAGVVTQRNVDHGTFVLPAESNSAATPLFEVTRTDRVRVVVGVPNNKVAGIEPGLSARLHTVGGLPGRSFLGSVTRSAGALDPKTRTMRIEVEFENPVNDEQTGEDVALKPGMFGSLSVIRRAWTKEAPIPVVPTQAVATDGSGVSYVVVVEAGDRTRRNVQIAFNDAISVGISTGLEVGETVATSGLEEYR